MSMLAPSAGFHAELLEQLDGVGHILAVRRILVWAARGLVAGMVIDLAVIAWAWVRETQSSVSLSLLVGAPIAAALVVGLATLLSRQRPAELARQIDRAGRLQERAVTALELGARRIEHPLALVQMRDAVEHLRRVEPLEVFPLQVPKRELIAAAVGVVLTLLLLFTPNPWGVRARAANPAISVAREQAQRVERLASSLPAEDNAQIDQLRDLLRRGAQTVDTRSGEPEAALAALEDLEDKVRQLGAGDDQLAAALAAIASALAGDSATSGLAAAINTGDLREISQASRDLAQRTEEMDGQERERVTRTLRDAASRASRASPGIAAELSQAADALSNGGSGGEAGGQLGQQRAGQGARSAREALEQLSDDVAAAAERQRAQSQLEASRNALERSLGRSQSRSGGASSRSSSGAQRGQRSQAGAGESGEGQEQGGDPSGGSGSGAMGDENGGNQPGQSGAGTGTQNRTGDSPEIDTITRAELVGGTGASPDMTSGNAYLSEASDGASRAGEEAVQPSFERRATQGGDAGAIPLGLRDLVKDYFTSLDQR